MSTPFGTELSAQQQKTLAWLERERTCVRCRAPYREITNLGRHECEYYHPLLIARDTRGCYACCHRPIGSSGCVKADHTDGDGDRVAVAHDELKIDVTNDEALLMAAVLRCRADDVRRPSWTLDAAHGVWRVARCDIVARATAMHRQYDVLQ